MTHENDKLRRLHAWVILRRSFAGMRAAHVFDTVLIEVERLLHDAATGQPGDQALRDFLAWARAREHAGAVTSPTIAAVVELARRSLAARTIGDLLPPAGRVEKPSGV